MQRSGTIEPGRAGAATKETTLTTIALGEALKMHRSIVAPDCPSDPSGLYWPFHEAFRASVELVAHCRGRKVQLAVVTRSLLRARAGFDVFTERELASPLPNVWPPSAGWVTFGPAKGRCAKHAGHRFVKTVLDCFGDFASPTAPGKIEHRMMIGVEKLRRAVPEKDLSNMVLKRDAEIILADFTAELDAAELVLAGGDARWGSQAQAARLVENITKRGCSDRAIMRAIDKRILTHVRGEKPHREVDLDEVRAKAWQIKRRPGNVTV